MIIEKKKKKQKKNKIKIALYYGILQLSKGNTNKSRYMTCNIANGTTTKTEFYEIKFPLCIAINHHSLSVKGSHP
jgi:hypothetical protein